MYSKGKKILGKSLETLDSISPTVRRNSGYGGRELDYIINTKASTVISNLGVIKIVLLLL